MNKVILPLAILSLTACSAADNQQLPGNAQDDQPFAGIADNEVISLVGTEPFWDGEIARGIFTYNTTEDPHGQRIVVTRFAGRGGLSFSGEAAGQQVDIAITPGICSDGMAEIEYPFTVTLQIGDVQRSGCGWSDVQPRKDVSQLVGQETAQ